MTNVPLCAVLLRRRCFRAPGACCRRAVQQSINIACPPGTQQQTCRTLL